MKNIHILPTDKPSRLHKSFDKAFILSIEPTTQNELYKSIPQNIYITNDEEIKEGDYVYHNSGYVSIVLGFNLDAIKLTDSQRWSKDCKKIILTTDDQLIQDGVQAIDDEFLEWFVKNPNCEKVEVTYDKDAFPYGVETSKEYGWYKIIIPQEEPKQETQGYICPHTKIQCDDECCVSAEDCHIKASIGILSEPEQETLEQVAKKWYSPFGFYPDPKQGFIAGAEWQAEKMYSESEVIILLNKFGSKVYGNYTRNKTMEDFCDKWFEQNKKK
jgi:hypothetical protein